MKDTPIAAAKRRQASTLFKDYQKYSNSRREEPANTPDPNNHQRYSNCRREAAANTPDPNNHQRYSNSRREAAASIHSFQGLSKIHQ
ncbi:hypothetical protein TYRP_014695 [Tyrophagus putrescentiae]|nr:hypothetical protein TYRP_014695 [Tyrophagus putrescentiae]